MAIKYKLFGRLLLRADEVASQSGISAVVTRVHGDVLKGPATAFLTAEAALTTAISAQSKESGEAKAALAKIDKSYGVARAAAMAYQPHLVLPETLKSVPTDTDKMDAIETLLEVLEVHANEGWAKELLDGEFGKLAPEAVREIDEGMRADATLSAARSARSAAYGPAYDAYLSFKRVVRAACGPKSREYHRIHVRSVDGTEPEEPVAPVEPVVPPAPPTPPTPPTPADPTNPT